MRRRGPSWRDVRETREQAEQARVQLAETQRELESLRLLNKQMLTEMQVETADPIVAVKDAKFLNGLGKFMVPKHNTLTNNYRLVYDRSNELDFWPDQAPAFDSLVSQTFLRDAFSDSDHPRYYDYEPLRDNIATVRNYLMYAVLHGVEPTNQAQLERACRKLEQMGREVGVALQRDTMTRAPGSTHLNVDEASVPGVGAAKIYAYLVEKQEADANKPLLGRMFNFLNKRVGRGDYDQWHLPPVEKSPFSEAYVNEFCLGDFNIEENPSHLSPQQVIEMNIATKRARMQAEALLQQQEADIAAAAPSETPLPEAATEGISQAQRMSIIGASLAASAFSLDRVKRLPTPVKERSIEIARDILEKLRVELGNTDREAWLGFSTEEVVTQGDAISSLSALYGESYQAALAVDPAMKDNATLRASNEAVGKLAYLMKEQAAEELLAEGKTAEAQVLQAELAHYPENWKELGDASVGDLLAQMQTGLDLTYDMVQHAQAQHLRTQEALEAQETVDIPARPRQPHAAVENPPIPAVLNASAVAPAQPQHSEARDDAGLCAASLLASNADGLSAESMQQLLENGGISPQDLKTVRALRNQAAAMPAPKQTRDSHALMAERAPAMAQAAPQESYRTAAQQVKGAEPHLKR